MFTSDILWVFFVFIKLNRSTTLVNNENHPKEQLVVQPSKAKRMKLFDFMIPGTVPAIASPQSPNQPDFGRAYQHFLNLPPTASLAVFNESQLICLRPIALKLFSAPSSSASSERVFSQAGLIMRATRSRLSQIRLSHLVFLKCSRHLK